MDELITPNTLHIRFEGRSWNLPMRDLDLGQFSCDDDVRSALALYLGVPRPKLDLYVVERHANGNITVRPEAVFGR